MGHDHGVRDYHHPKNGDEVCELIERARNENKKIRVAGARHSESKGIFAPDDHYNLMLDQMRSIEPAEDAGERKRFWVGAGCNLGKDPWDPSGTSKWVNSLNYQLEQMGLALDSMGGISHQSIAGFLSTGSGGGSTRHSAHHNVIGLEIVDAKGNKQIVQRGKDELFDAAGVSMGLLGVITRVKIEVGPTYDLDGGEETADAADCTLVDFFDQSDDNRPTLAEFFEKKDYARVLWWPQFNLNRIQVWHGTRAPRAPGQHNKFTILEPWEMVAGAYLMTVVGHRGRLDQVKSRLEAVNFYERFEEAIDQIDDEDINACPSMVRHADRDKVMDRASKVIGGAMANDDPELINEGYGFLTEKLGKAALWLVRGAVEDDSTIRRAMLDAILDNHLHSLIDNIVGSFITKGQKYYRDSWMCALPMDNQMDDQLWGTRFTELWIPYEHTQAAIDELQTYFHAGGDARRAYERTGPYAHEIYAGTPSNFWLSPGYDPQGTAGKPWIRFDPFWFSNWGGDPNFDDFFDMFEKWGFRPHWGKILPKPGERWRAHYRKHFPKLEDFLELRAERDPDGIFLTQYWRDHLGI